MAGTRFVDDRMIAAVVLASMQAETARNAAAAASSALSSPSTASAAGTRLPSHLDGAAFGRGVGMTDPPNPPGEVRSAVATVPERAVTSVVNA